MKVVVLALVTAVGEGAAVAALVVAVVVALLTVILAVAVGAEFAVGAAIRWWKRLRRKHYHLQRRNHQTHYF